MSCVTHFIIQLESALHAAALRSSCCLCLAVIDAGTSCSLGRMTASDNVLWSPKDACRSDDDYKMLVVTQACNISNLDQVKDLDAMLKQEFGLTHEIRWVGIISTFKTPGVPDTGGRQDAFFLVHTEDIPKLSIAKRIYMGFRWWSDIIMNGGTRLYPLKFRRMYPAL